MIKTAAVTEILEPLEEQGQKGGHPGLTSVGDESEP